VDIPRPNAAKLKRRKRILITVAVAAGLIVVTFVLSRLKPAVPTVDRNLVWIDTVKRGPMTRQVRGLGTLVPEDIEWIAARTQGRVEKIVLRPGAPVTPESVILVLSNPSVVQASIDAESQLKSAEAALANIRVTMQGNVLTAEANLASAKSTYETTRLQAEVNGELFKDGLVPLLTLKSSQVAADDAKTQYQIAQKRYDFAKESVAPQLAVQEALVDQARSQALLRRDDAEHLQVRAGMAGVLQLLPVDVGQQVDTGTNLARVANPTKLKAVIQIAETQAKDIQLGQPASIDTRNGLVPGRVSRIDPSVQNGTVSVDVSLTGPLPKGARPDLSVDGTIELEHLNDVVYVGRPAFGQENSTVGIFKLDPDGVYATRVQVELGRSSVNNIEILKGLKPGDRVILSDMSQWDANDRIRLN
jgi:HlyD family secretion protein